jgi:hypothetical protein
MGQSKNGSYGSMMAMYAGMTVGVPLKMRSASSRTARMRCRTVLILTMGAALLATLSWADPSRLRGIGVDLEESAIYLRFPSEHHVRIQTTNRLEFMVTETKPQEVELRLKLTLEKHRQTERTGVIAVTCEHWVRSNKAENDYQIVSESLHAVQILAQDDSPRQRFPAK